MLVLSSRAKWRDAPMPARRGDADHQGIADRDHQGTEGLASDHPRDELMRATRRLGPQKGTAGSVRRLTAPGEVSVALSRCRVSCSPRRCSGPPFVGVIERPDFRIAKQPRDLLDRHAVIRQITRGKALSYLFKDFAEGRPLIRQVPG